MHVKKLIVILILFGATAASFAQSPANCWPGYRGPSDDGHSQAKNIPVTWSDSTHIAWKVMIPGRGWSSPVVQDGQVWLTTSDTTKRELRAIAINGRDGSIIHNIKVFDILKPQESHPLNSFASPSPVIEAGRVYVHFGAYGTACLDTQSGKIIWKRTDILCEHEVGPGSSPILYQNMLILTMDGTDVQYVETLDKRTGKTIWHTPRGLDFTAKTPDTRKAFTTPVVSKVDGRDLIISAGPHAVMAYEPQTGREVWRVLYQGFSASARPVIGNEMIFINTGFGMSNVMAIRLGGSGDKTATAIVWTNKRNMAARSSPLLIDGLLYMVNTAGQAKCLDPATGAEIWTERVGLETSASPVYIDGKIYTFDQSGLTTVFKPGRTFIKIAENQLSDGYMASPAVVDGALYLRSKTYLFKVSISN
ncbi:MAG: PQQ-binding-like beta-propeller repeat protein [Bacteroidales bacterium]|nr:PQQ-binding-like beta-propeller repeat protein [Bacteroidales bacterium]